MASFLAEIKRRKVFQVTAVYVVVAWVVVQVVATVEEPLSLPSWFDTTVIVLLGVGLPIAIVLSWAFDLTKQGLVRSPPADAMGNEPERLPNSVAVLPFENLSPNADDAYFAAGIHEEILNHLAKIRELNIIARTSVMQYAGVARSIAEIAEELNVEAIMEGSVRYSGERVRVTAQLIDGRTGTHLWTEAYDRNLADIFEIQTDIATHIASALETALSPGEREMLNERPTESTEAYRLYLRALPNSTASDPTGLPSERARWQAYLDRAIELDNTFAAAHARKAELFLSSRQNDPVSPGEWQSRKRELEKLIVEHAQRALDLDPKLGYARTVLGALHFYNWRGKEARAEFEQALHVGPNEVEVYVWYGAFEYAQGRFESAIKLYEKGRELDPNNPLVTAELSYCLWQTGRLDDAAEAIDRSLQLDPGAAIWLVFQAGVLLAQKDEAGALSAVQFADRQMPKEASPGIRAHVGWFFGRLGQRQDAKRIYSELEATARERYVDPASWAWANIGIGNYDRALELYQEVRSDVSLVQDPFELHLARQNFCSDPVLEEPRFQEVLSDLWITQ